MAEFRPYVPNATDFHPQEISDSDTIRSGGANFQGAVAMNGNKVTGAGDPTAAQDLATKAYVDAIDAGLLPKDSVRLGTAAALPAYTASGGPGVGRILTADAVGILTVDTVNSVVGDDILVKDEALSHVDHGIYTLTTEGTAGVAFVLTRRGDFDQDAEVQQGSRTIIREGGQQKTQWMVLTADPIVVDTTAIEFTIIGDNSALIGGDGIDVSANTISVDLATVSGLEFSGGELRIDIVSTDELSIDANGLNVEGVPSLFKINGSAVGATVTAANLDTLTNTGNADALHTHANVGNPQETTDGVGVSLGDPIYYSANGIVTEADAAAGNARKIIGLADATVGAAASVGIANEGDLLTVTPAGTTPAAGDLVYLANGGGLTVDRPNVSGDRIVVVGKMRSATEVRVGGRQFMGTKA